MIITLFVIFIPNTNFLLLNFCLRPWAQTAQWAANSNFRQQGFETLPLLVFSTTLPSKPNIQSHSDERMQAYSGYKTILFMSLLLKLEMVNFIYRNSFFWIQKVDLFCFNILMPTSVQSFVIQIANMLYLKFCAFQQQGSLAPKQLSARKQWFFSYQVFHKYLSIITGNQFCCSKLENSSYKLCLGSAKRPSSKIQHWKGPCKGCKNLDCSSDTARFLAFKVYQPVSYNMKQIRAIYIVKRESEGPMDLCSVKMLLEDLLLLAVCVLHSMLPRWEY